MSRATVGQLAPKNSSKLQNSLKKERDRDGGSRRSEEDQSFLSLGIEDAWNDQKLDFRAIAATFGLEPSTVKLNDHFITRGVDRIATSVTWQSLLAFFATRGLSTGKHEADALHGKLSRVGTKRAHTDPQEVNDLGLIKPKKLKAKCSVGKSLIYGCNKRQLLSEEDTHSLALAKFQYKSLLSIYYEVYWCSRKTRRSQRDAEFHE